MTIFPIKWRANEQLGGGWAPTSKNWCLDRIPTDPGTRKLRSSSVDPVGPTVGSDFFFTDRLNTKIWCIPFREIVKQPKFDATKRRSSRDSQRIALKIGNPQKVVVKRDRDYVFTETYEHYIVSFNYGQLIFLQIILKVWECTLHWGYLSHHTSPINMMFLLGVNRAWDRRLWRSSLFVVNCSCFSLGKSYLVNLQGLLP